MRTIAVCGHSLLMSSVGASLSSRANVKVKVLEPEATVPSKVRQLRAFRADAVVFPLGGDRPDWVVELLKAQPELVLVGIDLDSDKALVVSGCATPLATGADLLQVIESHFERRAGPKEP